MSNNLQVLIWSGASCKSTDLYSHKWHFGALGQEDKTVSIALPELVVVCKISAYKQALLWKRAELSVVDTVEG